MKETPLSDRLCDLLCITFALWTICSHLVVVAGGVLRSLILAFTVAVISLVFVFATALRWRKTGMHKTGWRKYLFSITPPQAEESSPPTPDHRRQTIQWLGLILGLAGALTFHWHGNTVLLWWFVAIVLAIGTVSSIFQSLPTPVSPGRGPRLERILWLLAVFCVIITLITHRYDPDDSVYVNLAVAAADLPGWPLLSTDTLHDIPELPLHMPAYRLHSYELLNGALSYLTGIPAIFCFHWISAALAALFVPLALAKLFRQLTPRTWLVSTVCAVIVLLAVGGIHRWYGNFAFFRMWQGKSVFLTLFLPLIYAYGTRFALHPTRWNWALLAAAQIAALGCTSSAVWSAPASATMAVAAALQPKWKDVGLLILGVLSSSYIVAAGLYLKSTIVQAVGFSSLILDTELGENLNRALTEVLGESATLVFGILSFTIVWTLYPSGLARRFSAVIPFVVWIVFLNPYWDAFLIHNLVGPSYWRVMWALPVPILMALLLASPLGFRAEREKRASGIALVAALTLVFMLFIPPFHGLSEKNRVYVKMPDLKVWRPTYDWAKELVEKVPPRSTVVVPDDIGQWIPTFHNHPFPLEVRKYLYVNRHRVDKGDYALRQAITQYIAGEPMPTEGDEAIGETETLEASEMNGEETLEASESFKEGLKRYGVTAVILARNANTEDAKAILRKSNFGLMRRGEKRELWLSSEVFESAYIFDDGFEGGDLRSWTECSGGASSQSYECSLD